MRFSVRFSLIINTFPVVKLISLPCKSAGSFPGCPLLEPTNFLTNVKASLVF